MKSSIFALGSLLFTLVAAQPHRAHHKLHQKRDVAVVWTTDWVIVTETAEYVETIIVDAQGSTISQILAEVTPTPAAPAEFFQPASQSPSEPTSSAPPTPTLIPSPTPAAAKPEVAAAVESSPPPSSSVFVPPPPPPPPPAPPAPTTSIDVAPAQPTPSSTSTTSASSTPVVDPPIVAAAVLPTTSQFIAPAVAQTSAAPAPAPSSPSSSSGSSSNGSGCSESNPCKGEVTYYEAGLGACGITNDGSVDKIVALPVGLMGAQSNGNEWCGKTVTISVGSTSIVATIQDKCPSCQNNHLDLSNAAFLALGLTLDQGVGQAEWYFN